MVCFPFFSLFFIIIIILFLREHPPDLKTPVLKLTNESKEGEKQKKKKKEAHWAANHTRAKEQIEKKPDKGLFSHNKK